MVRFGVLGPLEAVSDGVDVVPASAKQRLLLAVLLVHRNEVVSVDRLVDALWEDRPPASAPGVLRTYVSQLRKAIEPDLAGGPRTVLVTADPGYRLVAPAGDVDADRFERLVAEGHAALLQGRPVLAAALLREGLALWRGPAFADVRDEGPVRDEALRLDELRTFAVEERVDADLAVGDHGALVGELAQLVAAHPLRERFCAQRMRCLYRMGRQAEALEVYQQLRRRLGEELGLAPSPALVELERDILNHAPGLDLSSAGVGPEPAPGRRRAVPASNVPAEREPLPFVGREAAMDAVAAWWADAPSASRLLLVSGEPGVGKTRLVTTFARSVETGCAAVLYGRAVEAGGSAYEPVLGALRQLVLTAPDGLVDQMGETGAAAMSRLVPELGERRPELAVRGAAWGDVDRSWLLGAVADCFVAPEQDPILFVLDDLQWADRPAMLLLARLVEAGTSVRVLATARSATGALAPHLGGCLAELRRADRPVRRLALGGLAPDDVVDLLGALSGAAVLPAEGRACAAQLHRRTDGNPFFLREALRQLRDAGALAPEEGIWATAPALDELSRGEGVRDVVGHRLAQLAPATREALRVAAVLGREFDLDIVAAVLEVTDEHVVGAVEEAQALGLIAEDPARLDRYGFVHALVHEVARSELGASRRARFEWRAGEAIATRRTDELDELAGEVARHLTAGVPPGDPRKAVAWSLRAAQQAMDGLAYEDAIRCYDMALRSLGRVGGPSDDERADVLVALGRAANLAGDPQRWRESCLEAATLARRAHDPERLARAAISLLGTLGPGATDASVVAVLEEAADEVRTTGTGAGKGLLAELLARLSGYLSDADPHRSAVLADEALRAARQAGDERSLALALVYSTQARPVERAEHLARRREAGDLARRVGDPEVLLAASSQQMAGALLWADRSEYDRGLAAYVEVAHATGRAVPLVLSDVNRACGVALDGRCEDALALFEDAMRRSKPFGDPNRHGIRAATVLLDLELGLLPTHEARIRRTAAEGNLFYEAVLIRMLCSSRQVEEAAMRLQAIVATPERLRLASIGRLILGLLGEAGAEVGDVDAATVLYDHLEGERRFGDCVTLGAHTYFGAIQRHLGLLAVPLGRVDEAVAHHEAALDVHRRMRAPGWVARSRYDLACALFARGGAGDRDRARHLLDEALSVACDLQMPRLLEELRAVT